jgi:hypothetical protein
MKNAITLAHNYKGTLPMEGYELQISENNILLNGSGPGMFYGLQTLMQLIQNTSPGYGTIPVGGTIQAVEGVTAVDLDRGGVRLTGLSGKPTPILVARPGRAGRAGHDGPEPAQLLTVNPAGVTIARRT